MRGKLEINIYRVPATRWLGVWITRETEDGIWLAEPVELTFKESSTGSEVPPTLKFCYPDSEKFLKAMAEAIDEYGLKTDSDAKIAGIMEAQKYHLEDLRSMLNLKGEKHEYRPDKASEQYDK